MTTLEFILNKMDESLTYEQGQDWQKGELKMPYKIPNVSRLDLVKWIRELDFKIGAEIGVAFAEYSKLICEINPQMTLYGVDAWRPYSGYSDYTRKGTFELMYSEAMTRMRSYIQKDRFVPVEKLSMDAVGDFEDGSLDFVYIDANHQDPFVTDDINAWSKKVRSGGIIAGHDYVRVKRVNWKVKDAVQRYAREHDINPWFVLGADAVETGVVREGGRSWMLVNP